MNSTRLADIKQDCARIMVQWGNGYLDSILRGTPKENEIFNDTMRVHYLYGIIKELYLSGTDVCIGDVVLADNAVEAVFDKIWHYNGVSYGIDFNADLSDFDAIVPDDGDGGTVDPTTPTTDSDHYRVGELPVTVGTNAVTFFKDGVAAPFPSTDYIVIAWVETHTGYRQSNLQPSTYTAGGFIVTDVLEAGILKYQAILNS